ncbi:energy-coupling factor transporter ATPase [Bifidobacterium platyrrhinorum]|uniref:ATP-binding cassette domain-containing protein n=1 Tax=Bifidobacterium platyrrhinorum TaxID=2661628 RepID=A0A6L9STX4_9BIFI|nr:energy-coupling factor transporter ATPase [Bifidobacterium platyrrhinorum]NEG56030.1 ATP-binding cassette domain-containing protein [Bifidobacterium platyrrhinorum]
MNLAELDHIRFSYDGGAAWALDDASLTVREGDYVALTGANGSGKSTLARLIAGLAAPDSGTVILLGRTVFSPAGPDADAYRAARRGIGAVFQNPEDQLVTTVLEDDVAFGPENLGVPRDGDDGNGRGGIGERIAESLHAVRLDDMRRANPIRMSGGQQQRAAIAGMLAMRPRLLVLDEPTAMLDPLARREVMDVLDELHAAGTTIVHVTHHADEIARAGRIVRLDGGRVVADGEECSVSGNDGSGVSRSTAAGPSPARPAGEGRDVMLSVSHVSYAYAGGDGPILDDVSLEVREGETVALMGANGSGKSTLLRLVCALAKPDSGSITVDGMRVDTAKRRELATLRRTVGLVMQHPERQLFADTVRDDVAYGPANQGLPQAEIDERVDEALRVARMNGLADRSPFDLSGGQQRLAAIAGVIACRPKLLVMDEPTAGLDADARERVYRLIDDLHARGVTVLVVTHSHTEARRVADRVVDMATLTGAGTTHDELGIPVGATHDAGTGAADGAPTGTAFARHDSDGSQAVARRGPRNAPQRAVRDASRATAKSSPVARLDPRVKMVAFLVAMFSAFGIGDVCQLLAGAAFTAGVVAAARLRPARLLGSVRMFLGLFAVMGLLNVFFVRTGSTLFSVGPVPVTDDGVATAVLYTCRFALVIILGAVFLATTTPTAITDAFAALLSPLHRLGVHTQEIALVLSLALRFIPTLAVEAQAVADAQAARGGSIETGSLPQRVKAMTAIIVPIFAGALRHADNLSLALDARCYEEGIRRTHWRVMRVAARDVAFAAVLVLYLAALVALAVVAA